MDHIEIAAATTKALIERREAILAMPTAADLDDVAVQTVTSLVVPLADVVLQEEFSITELNNIDRELDDRGERLLGKDGYNERIDMYFPDNGGERALYQSIIDAPPTLTDTITVIFNGRPMMLAPSPNLSDDGSISYYDARCDVSITKEGDQFRAFFSRCLGPMAPTPQEAVDRVVAKAEEMWAEL